MIIKGNLSMEYQKQNKRTLDTFKPPKFSERGRKKNGKIVVPLKMPTFSLFNKNKFKFFSTNT